MRVLHINKFAWPKGGSDIYALRLASFQANLNKWPTAIFGASPDYSFDVEYFPVEVPDFHAAKSPINRVRAAGNVLWARKVSSSLEKVLNEFKPDIVHLHSYAHQLSPSIIGLLRKQNVPTVMTSHDYKLICPSYTAVRDGHDCFDCAVRLSLLPIKARCLNGNVQWSTVALAESAFVRRTGLFPRHIIAPSAFMQEKLKSSWLSKQAETYLVRNPSEPSGISWHGSGGYLLYVGRLSKEKGIDSLIEAASKIGVQLRIAGDGPYLPELTALVADLKDSNVDFLGRLNESELAVERAACLAQVLPSAWPENAPLAALEAAMDGVPLIVSDRGGLPEILQLGLKGAVMESCSPTGLADAINKAQSSSSNNLSELQDSFGWSHHLGEIETVYMTVLAGKIW